MKVYGDIQTNLRFEEENKFNYSVDSLTFSTPEGDIFNIDFEEGDFGTSKEGLLHFRLKSLGTTFMDEWEDLKLNEGFIFENDFEFFEKCKLEFVNIYVCAEDNEYRELTEGVKIKKLSISLLVGEGRIAYTSAKVNF